MPTELELIALQTEFDLYLGFVKRLVLDLPNSKDRTKAALWLQKLRNVTADDQMKLRNEHLKLFLFALHRRCLVGVFQKKPPKEELESFHDGLTLMEMTRELIEITERQKTETKKEGEPGFGECPLPVVTTSLSCDMKEYAACQEIPLFGSHCFYAVSSEPIQLWNKSPGQAYPGQGDVPNQLEWELSMSKLTDHVLEMQAAIDAARDAEEQAESGFVFDEGPQEEHKEERLEVTPCKESTPGEASPNIAFKWKNDSILMIHQTYDFSDVGVAEDLEEQGKSQLETDEEVLAVLDDSLPGRKRLHVRSPFYSGFPPDLAERRHHGVYDEVPEIDEDECFGPPCEEEEDECDDAGDDDYEGSNYGSGSCFCDEPHESGEGTSGGRASGTQNMTSSFGSAPRPSGGFNPDQMPSGMNNMASKGSIMPQNGNGNRSSKGNRGSNGRPC